MIELYLDEERVDHEARINAAVRAALPEIALAVLENPACAITYGFEVAWFADADVIEAALDKIKLPTAFRWFTAGACHEHGKPQRVFPLYGGTGGLTGQNVFYLMAGPNPPGGTDMGREGLRVL